MRRTRRGAWLLVIGFAVLALGLGQAARAQDAIALPSGDAAPRQACQPIPQAQLALTEWGRHFVSPMMMNGKEVQLVIDTGTQETTVTPALDALLQLPVNESLRYHTISIGGTGADQYKHIVSSLKIGPLEWPHLNVGVDEFLNEKQRSDPASPDGLLGADVLSGYDVEFDFPAKTMTFYKTHGCQGSFAPWQDGYEVLPSSYSTSHHAFAISAVFDGHPLRAMLDTGSAMTVVTRAAAINAGVAADTLDDDPLLMGLQSTGSNYSAHLHPFDTIDIGGARYRNIPVKVVDTRLPDADILLGMDFMKNWRIWLSYGTGQVFVQRPMTSASPPAQQMPISGDISFMPPPNPAMTN